jgi:hypothetical protein
MNTDIPNTLDAKWIDPEFYNGCQSLVILNKLETLKRDNMELRDKIEYLQDKINDLSTEIWEKNNQD